MLVYDELILREPGLYVPGRKPVGPVRVDRASLLPGTLGWWPILSTAPLDALSHKAMTVLPGGSFKRDGQNLYLDGDGTAGIASTGVNGVVGTSAGFVLVRFRASSVSGRHTLVSWGSTQGQDGGQHFQINIELGGELYIRVFAGAELYGSGYDDGKWHWAAATWPAGSTNGDIRVFVDGADLGSGTDTRTLNFSTDVGVNIGWQYRTDGSDHQYADADISDVIVGNRELPAVLIWQFMRDPYVSLIPA